jgi:hypothetical protein
MQRSYMGLPPAAASPPQATDGYLPVAPASARDEATYLDLDQVCLLAPFLHTASFISFLK